MYGQGALGGYNNSGTGVPPVCSKPETHGRDAVPVGLQ